MGMFHLPKVADSSYLKALRSSAVMKVDKMSSIQEHFLRLLFSNSVLKLSLNFS
jgi:hypothetical protein